MAKWQGFVTYFITTRRESNNIVHGIWTSSGVIFFFDRTLSLWTTACSFIGSNTRLSSSALYSSLKNKGSYTIALCNTFPQVSRRDTFLLRCGQLRYELDWHFNRITRQNTFARIDRYLFIKSARRNSFLGVPQLESIRDRGFQKWKKLVKIIFFGFTKVVHVGLGRSTWVLQSNVLLLLPST